MDINKYNSSFTYLGNSIRKMEITNNIINVTSNVSISYDLDVDIKDISKTEEGIYGIVIMEININLNCNDFNSKLSFQFEGAFLGDNSLNKEFENILLVNGSTCLYSIARSKIENISSLTFNNYTIKLPMINMIEFLENKYSQ